MGVIIIRIRYNKKPLKYARGRDMNSCLLIAASFIFVCAAFYARAADRVIDQTKYTNYLFVFGAKSGSVEGDTLALKGVPNVVYFSDRPYRIAGHMDTDTFVRVWREGKDSFNDDPPNGTLSYMGKDGVKSVLVELSNTNIDLLKRAITFDAGVLDGDMPESFGKSTLFLEGSAAKIYQQ